jgi:hypothetical protein
MDNKNIVACPLKVGIVPPEETSVTRLRHSNETIEHVTLRYVTNGSTAGSDVFCCVRSEAISRGPTGQASDSRVVSLKLEVGRETRQRSSQTVAPGGGVGGGGTLIVVRCCVVTPSLFVR